MIALYCVSPGLVGNAIPLIRKHLEAAAEYGDWTTDEVVTGLTDGRFLLWLPMEDSHRILGAIVTELIHMEKTGKLVNVVSCGGERFSEWRHVIADIEAYARAEGCTRVRITGRKGWTRMYSDYREPYVTLEKALI